MELAASSDSLLPAIGNAEAGGVLTAVKFALEEVFLFFLFFFFLLRFFSIPTLYD